MRPFVALTQIAFAVVVFPNATPGQTSPLAPTNGITTLEATSFCREMEAAFAGKDAKRYGFLLASNYDGDLGCVDREKALERFRALFETHREIQVALKPVAFDEDRTCAALTVNAHFDLHGDKSDVLAPDATYLWVLAREDGRVKLRTEIEIESDSAKRSHAPAFESTKAGFHVDRPADWLFLDPKKKGLTSDMVLLLKPSSESLICLAGLDLPRETDPKEVQTGDDAMLQSLCPNEFQLLRSGPIEIGSAKGYQSLLRCTFEGRQIERWRLTFIEGRAMYAIVCHSTPPEQFERERDAFERVVNSFRITAPCCRPAGAVDGRIYRSSEVRCQFAAPTGWLLQPARSDLAFQVYVNPPDGKSYVLVGAENVKYAMNESQLADVLDEVEKSLKRVDPTLTRYREVRDVVVDGRPAKEVVWDLSLPGDLARRRKAVYFSLGNYLCFFHCDVIPKADFDRMEPDFDRIVHSFLRSQE
ncbi:MAG: nuclear transport factor 2 family protein [Planctomycetes bacterium]|nr:nuclear transport factor 2 family protein [Planctomycetota bacterium]MBI3846474.1 nuclear transport factor 2 family protein [Planctomycetota bacterium]